jgi:hypothetical protein
MEVANAILYFGSLSQATVRELEEILAHGGSAYRLNDGGTNSLVASLRLRRGL